MGLIIYIGIFMLLNALAIFVILKPYFNDKTARNSVVNYDITTRNYCFLLKDDKQKVIEKLLLPSVYDNPRYSFDDTEMTITFMQLNAKFRYQLTFFKSGERTYMNAYRTHPLLAQTIHPYVLNSFFINKINAVPVTIANFGTIMNQTENT